MGFRALRAITLLSRRAEASSCSLVHALQHPRLPINASFEPACPPTVTVSPWTTQLPTSVSPGISRGSFEAPDQSCAVKLGGLVVPSSGLLSVAPSPVPGSAREVDTAPDVGTRQWRRFSSKEANGNDTTWKSWISASATTNTDQGSSNNNSSSAGGKEPPKQLSELEELEAMLGIDQDPLAETARAARAGARTAGAYRPMGPTGSSQRFQRQRPQDPSEGDEADEEEDEDDEEFRSPWGRPWDEAEAVQAELEAFREEAGLSEAAGALLRVHDLDLEDGAPAAAAAAAASEEDADEAGVFLLRRDRHYYPGQMYLTEELDPTEPLPEESQGLMRRRERTTNSKEVLRGADFRNVRLLSHFISGTSRILPRHKTHLSAKAQRKVAREIRIARAFGLMPFTSVGQPTFRFRSPRGDEESEMPRSL